MAQEHTVRSFDDELNELRSIISQMGGMAEAQLASAMEAVSNRNDELAHKVLAADQRLDRLEADADKLAVEIIARRAPMANDLREIIAALKTASMLERIGDYAKNIAKRSTVLSHSKAVAPASVVPAIAGESQQMIREVLDAFIERDSDRAVEVWERDQRVDQLYDSLFRELLTYMMENPKLITPCTHLLFIAKNLERIGDHATNIAEIVYFAVEGKEMDERRPKGDETSFAVVSPDDQD